MKPSLNTDRVKYGLREAILLLCKTGLSFESEICIEGLLGITLDQNEVFLVNIRETISNPMNLHVTSSEEQPKKVSAMHLDDRSTRSIVRIEKIPKTIEDNGELVIDEIYNTDQPMIIKEEIISSDDDTIINTTTLTPPQQPPHYDLSTSAINLSLQPSSSLAAKKILMQSKKSPAQLWIPPSTNHYHYPSTKNDHVSLSSHADMLALSNSYDELSEKNKWLSAMRNHFRTNSGQSEPSVYKPMSTQEMMSPSMLKCFQNNKNEAAVSGASSRKRLSTTCSECVNCGTNNTTLWRRSVAGESICNACGLYYKLHRVHRPLSLATGEIHSRRRRKDKISALHDIVMSRSLPIGGGGGVRVGGEGGGGEVGGNIPSVVYPLVISKIENSMQQQQQQQQQQQPPDTPTFSANNISASSTFTVKSVISPPTFTNSATTPTFAANSAETTPTFITNSAETTPTFSANSAETTPTFSANSATDTSPFAVKSTPLDTPMNARLSDTPTSTDLLASSEYLNAIFTETYVEKEK